MDRGTGRREDGEGKVWTKGDRGVREKGDGREGGFLIFLGGMAPT